MIVERLTRIKEIDLAITKITPNLVSTDPPASNNGILNLVVRLNRRGSRL